MDTTEQLRHKYTCKYCKKEYDEPVKECEGCGSSEFIETTYINSDKKKKSRLIAIILIIVGMILFIIFNILRTIVGGVIDNVISNEPSEYSQKEYTYDSSLLGDPEMDLGKTAGSSDIDYYNSIKITGAFHDLHDNIYKKISGTQFSHFTFMVPCDVEIKDTDLHIQITSLDFSYYDSKTGYVDMIGTVTGTTDKDLTLYLVDSNGSRDKLLVEEFKAKDYPTAADLLCSDEYRKGFSVNNMLTEYKTLLVEYGEQSLEFELDYGRSTGDVEYFTIND